MTTIDWIIVGFAALLALNGLRQGFIVGVLQMAGFAAGAFVGSRVGPLVLSGGAHSPYAPLFALGGAVLLGSLFAGALEMAGLALRRAVRLPGLNTLDGGLGAVLGAALALGIAWVAGAVALQTPGLDLRRDVQRSKILTTLNERLPPSGFLLNALARFDPLPEVRGPGPVGVAPPTAGIAADPDVQGSSKSVVRVLGTACGLGVEGSGWVARGGVVVTNAHVVAGEDDTIVQERGTGPRLAARVVLFDPTNDVAVLRVPALGAPALRLASDPPAGREAAVLGFPHNGSYTVRAARLGPTRDVISQDAYGRGPVRREVSTFRGRVEPGNSGGPLVDGGGQVVGTVFAATVGSGPRGGYGVPNDVVRGAVDAAGTAAVSTGSCTR
jgi:S1-C subfamily serine protease